jgi:hypothetical protein
MAVITRSLAALRADFNLAFPHREKKSDGWIGDLAHQQSTSGHNPDETGGGEYEDSDTKDEVRALDVDKDLNGPNTPMAVMQGVINRLLVNPKMLRRLRYIIFNRQIWSRSNNWRRAVYAGRNPHTEHAHFSGDPADDENDSDWAIPIILPRPGSEDDMGDFSTKKLGADVDNKTAEQLLQDMWYALVKNAANAKSLYAVLSDLKLTAAATLAATTDDTARLDAAKSEIIAAVEKVDEEVARRLGGSAPADVMLTLEAAMGEERFKEFVAFARTYHDT